MLVGVGVLVGVIVAVGMKVGICVGGKEGVGIGVPVAANSTVVVAGISRINIEQATELKKTNKAIKKKTQ